ncbi:MAG: hypothetical protein WC623_22170 [Pedobacter sp.]|uniref:hypothetical protein n=1 Tax=Pedobacter sp. TaxID=1411316 RepID=UPI0035644AAB
MVEQGSIITVYFGQFDSPYVGSPFLVGGNQIYSSIIREKGLSEAKSLQKVSHGVFHSILPESINSLGKMSYNKKDWKGWPVGTHITLSDKTMSKYEDFFQLRNYSTPFLKENNGNHETERIMRHHNIAIQSGENFDLFHADRLSFFTVGDHEIDLKQMQFGAKRNMGFGLFTITNSYSFNLNDLDYSVFGDDTKLIDTAKNGITGVLNHAKYGYGEFKLDSWGQKGWLVRLTSPLCLDSTVQGARHYSIPPSFMRSEGYRKHSESLWIKGKVEKLYCVSDGNVFLYAN